MMKKIGILLLTFVLLLSLTACGEKKPAGASATVVEVGGVSVSKAEAQEIYDAMVKQTALMYQQYGIALDVTNEEFITTTKTQTLNMIGEQLALELALKNLDLTLTDEDVKALEAAALNEYTAMIDEFVTVNNVSKEDAELAAQQAGYTQKAIDFAFRNNEVSNRLRQHYTADVTVSDDDILEAFDALIAEQKETYQTTSAQYATDVLNDAMIVYHPEGYRYIKNIVIAMPDDVMAQIEEKDYALYELSYELYMIEMELSAGEMDDDRKASLEADYATHTAEALQLEADIQALVQTGLDQVRGKAEEVLALCQAEGADFDAIMAEHSADVATGELVTRGYPVSAETTAYVESFTTASMALENIGDISGLVESEYGFHILKYASDVVSGVVPLDDVKDAIAETALAEKKETVLNDAMVKIIEETDIKIYINNF